MKNILNNYLIFFILIFLPYVFYNTGLHGDDYALIKELQNKVYFFKITPSNIGKYIYNIPSYIIWGFYLLIGDNHLFFYDLLKYFFNTLSILFIYFFFTSYLSKEKSLICSFFFILFPTHDTTSFWFMTTPLYVFFPSLIFLAHFLINKNNYFLGVIILIIGSFNYTSIPFIVGLSCIFLFQKKFNKFVLFASIGSIYVIFYFIISYFYSPLEQRIDDDLTFIIFFNNLILQLFSSLEANIGISALLKIFLSFNNLSLIDYLIGFVASFLIYKISLNYTYDKTNVILISSLLIVFLISLLMFAITGLYPQTSFSLGNRVTIYGSLPLVIIIFSLIKNRLFFLFLSIILCFSILGTSKYWKNTNSNHLAVINSVNDNNSLNKLKENDILFIKDNLYGYMGHIAHTEFLITPWVNQHIFKNFEKFKIVPVVSYISIDSNNIINFKDNSSIKADGNLYLYDTSINVLKDINLIDMKSLLEDQKPIVRHWLQLDSFSLISKYVIYLSPRLKYLFL